MLAAIVSSRPLTPAMCGVWRVDATYYMRRPCMFPRMRLTHAYINCPHHCMRSCCACTKPSLAPAQHTFAHTIEGNMRGPVGCRPSNQHH